MSPSVPDLARMVYTPYPGVNEAINLLLKNVRAVLGEYFLGMYLYGSLASGDFDPGKSDIDCLCVTTEEIPRELIPKLEAIYQRIKISRLEWAKKAGKRLHPRYFFVSLQRRRPAAPTFL